MERLVCEDKQDLSSVLDLEVLERDTVTSVPYLGTALTRKQSSWNQSSVSKQSVTASGSPSSFMVCQSQLAGMKQTGQLHTLHQLIGLMDSVTFPNTYASCQQSVTIYTTVCQVWQRESFFSRNQKHHI